MPTNSNNKASRFAKKPTARRQVGDLREQFEILRGQLQQISAKMAHDFRQLDERTMVGWEFLWSIVEALREDGKLAFMTEDNLEKFRTIVVAKWKQDALQNIKRKLTAGQGVCTRCHRVDGGPNFFQNKDKPDVPICPGCKTENTLYLKDTDMETPLPTPAEIVATQPMTAPTDIEFKKDVES